MTKYVAPYWNPLLLREMWKEGWEHDSSSFNPQQAATVRQEGVISLAKGFKTSSSSIPFKIWKMTMKYNFIINRCIGLVSRTCASALNRYAHYHQLACLKEKSHFNPPTSNTVKQIINITNRSSTSQTDISILKSTCLTRHCLKLVTVSTPVNQVSQGQNWTSLGSPLSSSRAGLSTPCSMPTRDVSTTRESLQFRAGVTPVLPALAIHEPSAPWAQARLSDTATASSPKHAAIWLFRDSSRKHSLMRTFMEKVCWEVTVMFTVRNADMALDVKSIVPQQSSP